MITSILPLQAGRASRQTDPMLPALSLSCPSSLPMLPQPLFMVPPLLESEVPPILSKALSKACWLLLARPRLNEEQCFYKLETAASKNK